MALPIQSTPVYNLTIPSTKKKVKFRPWLVREEKSLLLAQQSEDQTIMIDTLKSVIEECIHDKIDTSELSTFDLEYIFTQIRGKSVGEDVELIFKCGYCTDPKAKVKIKFDITKINVEFPENHTKKIQLFDNVGVVMKYPTIDCIKEIKIENDIEAIFNIVISCIDYIYDNEEVFYASETSKEELNAFLSQLTSEQFIKLEQFFDNLPKMKKEIDYTCPICGKDNHVVLEGMTSFF